MKKPFRFIALAGCCLAATGAAFSDLTKITVLATKLEYRAKIGEVRSRYLPQPPPASTFLVVSGLADPDFLVEIEGIAVMSAKR